MRKYSQEKVVVLLIVSIHYGFDILFRIILMFYKIEASLKPQKYKI